MKISVIVPTYNCLSRKFRGELCIEKSILSLNQQTLNQKDFEVLFIDDCSKDETTIFIDSICSLENYSIIKSKNNSGGASVPRNLGIKKARGRYIFFLDSDDYLSEDALENMYNYAIKCESDIVIPKVEGVGKGSAKKIFEKGNVKNAHILKNHLITTLSVFRLYKKSFIDDFNIEFPIDFNQYEDFYFNIKAFINNPRVSILADKPYYYWVMTDGEHLSQINIEFSHYLNLHKQIINLMSDERDQLMRNRYINRFLRLWPLTNNYKKLTDLNEILVANNNHILFRSFIKHVLCDVIDQLPKDDQLFLMSVLLKSREETTDMIEAVKLELDESKYIKPHKTIISESIEADIIRNYRFMEKYGYLCFVTKHIKVNGTNVNICGECFSGYGRNFNKYKLIIKNRSQQDSLILINDKPDFTFSIQDVYRFTNGFWDIYIEVDIPDVTIGCMVPMYQKKLFLHNKEDSFEIYKNWIGGATIRKV